MRLPGLLISSGALCALIAMGAAAQGIERPEIKLDDSFILGTRADVDQEEIATARWATTHASRKDVRAFAQTLLRGHSNAQNAAKDLAAAMKVDLKITGDTSDAISQRQKTTDAELRRISGARFDRAFLVAIRDEHIAEIDKVNNWYASVAASDQVKAYLHDIMPTLVKHRDTAERLLASSDKTVAIR